MGSSPQERGAATFRGSLKSRAAKARKSDAAYPDSWLYLRRDRRFPAWTRIGVSARPKARFVRVKGVMHPVARDEQELLCGVQVRRAYSLEQKVMIHFDSGGEEWLRASPKRVREYIESVVGRKMIRAADLPR